MVSLKTWFLSEIFDCATFCGFGKFSYIYLQMLERNVNNQQMNIRHFRFQGKEIII